MGNTDLRDLAAVESVAFGDLEGRLVAVDAHNWLYRYLTTTVRFTRDGVYTTDDGEEVPNLPGTVQGVAKLLEHDLVPAFVFDGEATDLKAEEVAERREARERAAERAEKAREAGDAVEAARLDSQSQRLTDVILRTTRELLELLDVPVVEAPAEGEAQAAHMAATGVVDYAGTEDYDALLFGAPLTLRQLTSSGDPELMDLAATLDEHDLTREQLVDVGILCGTDFNEGVHGVGPKTAVDAVREHGDLFGVLEARGEEMAEAERVRSLFLDPPVTDDVTVASEVEPDVESARAYVTEVWEVPDDEVARGFERIEEAVTQTGLDQWT